MARVFADGQYLFGQDCNSFQQTVGINAELRSIVGLPGMQIWSQGTAAPFDGGGGPFGWNATSTASDNGITVLKPTATTGAGRWILLNLGGSSTPLWSPGAPPYATTFTEFNKGSNQTQIAFNSPIDTPALQNGTKGLTIKVPTVNQYYDGESGPFNVLAGFRMTAEIDPPYTILFGIVQSYQNSHTSCQFGIGWTDGENNFDYVAINNEYTNNNYMCSGVNPDSDGIVADLTNFNSLIANPYGLIGLSNDGTYVSWCITPDGANFFPFLSKSQSDGNLGLGNYKYPCFIFGTIDGGGTSLDVQLSLFLFDPAGASRLPLAPGY